MSAQKVSQTLSVTSLTLLAIGLIVLFAPQTAVAQCGDQKSSCVTCHAKVDPVFTQGEWHVIHARKECCLNCHGGNERAQDKETAHVSMVLDPLTDTYTSCHSCHPDDYRQRAQRFAVVLHVTPQSSEPTARPTAVAAVPPPVITTPLPQAAANVTPMWDWPVALAIAVLVIGLATIGWKRSRSS